MNALAARTAIGFVGLMAALAVALFVPAGTFDFPEALVFLFVFGASAALISGYLWQRDPQLLERRVSGGPTAEKEHTQRVIQLIASVAFIGIIGLPALGRRFAWSHVPLSIVIAGDALVVIGFFLIFLVFRANTFTSATIEVAVHQTVTSSGPYAVVRHPMYSGALIMLLGTPLALGSWWGLIMFVPLSVAVIWRLLEEERFLGRNLRGYRDYCKTVRYRLIPSVW